MNSVILSWRMGTTVVGYAEKDGKVLRDRRGDDEQALLL